MRYCYITANFATNGYKIRLFITFILYHRAVVKQDNFFVELSQHRFVMQPLQNPPLCASTVNAFYIIVMLFINFKIKQK